MSPTARSLKHLRDLGYLAQVVERWNPGARRRIDLFGVGDIIAIKGRETLLIQACTTGDQTKRIAKILAEPRATRWLAGGVVAGASYRTLEVHGWALRGPRGKRKRWEISVHKIVCTPAGLDAIRIDTADPTGWNDAR